MTFFMRFLQTLQIYLGGGFATAEKEYDERNNTTPIIYVNGEYNIQFSREVRKDGGSCLRKKVLFNLLPLMNAEINAEYLYQKIFGGHIHVGQYSEYASGIYPCWSKEKPIMFVCHSYGCDVFIELIKLLESKGAASAELVSSAHLINPHFGSIDSNYENWYEKLVYVYLCICDIAHKSQWMTRIYSPRDLVLSANKIKTCVFEGNENSTNYKISRALRNHRIGGRRLFELRKNRKANDTPPQTLTEGVKFLNRHGICHNIIVGNIELSVGSFCRHFFVSGIFYLISFICLQNSNKIVKENLGNLTPCDHIFDGMCLYDYKECKKNNVHIVDGIGHLNFTSPW